MNRNYNPTDSERAEDQLRQCPGGDRPVEEPVAPQPSPVTEAEVNSERDEETAAPDNPPPPHAELEEDGHWIELPAELDAHFEALFARLQDGPVALEVDADGVARVHTDDMDPAVAEEALAFVRQLE
ncbi:hypothetical protein PTTG_25290, partial [Puccinia triticina 1-1 BBBD Race 1]